VHRVQCTIRNPNSSVELNTWSDSRQDRFGDLRDVFPVRGNGRFPSFQWVISDESLTQPNMAGQCANSDVEDCRGGPGGIDQRANRSVSSNDNRSLPPAQKHGPEKPETARKTGAGANVLCCNISRSSLAALGRPYGTRIPTVPTHNRSNGMGLLGCYGFLPSFAAIGYSDDDRLYRKQISPGRPRADVQKLGPKRPEKSWRSKAVSRVPPAGLHSAMHKA